MNNTEHQASKSRPSSNSHESLLKKRRAFIKSSAVAAPVILTLRSGSLLAAQSVSCDVKLKDGPAKSATPVTTASDMWMRQNTTCVTAQRVLKPAYTITHAAEGTNPEYKETVNAELDVNVIKVYQDKNTGGWFEFNQDNSGNPFISSDDMSNPDKWYQVNSEPCYVLQQFNDKGEPTYIGPSSALPYSTQSCITSLVNHP